MREREDREWGEDGVEGDDKEREGGMLEREIERKRYDGVEGERTERERERIGLEQC